MRENAPPRFCAPTRLCCALTICTRNRVSEAADLEEGLIAMQREYASEEARILGRSRCAAVYTWGYEKAFENGLDSNWAAQGWRGISFGLISPRGNVYAPVSQAPRSIWTVQESQVTWQGCWLWSCSLNGCPKTSSSARVEVCFAAGSVAAAKPKPPLAPWPSNRPQNEKPRSFVYRRTQGCRRYVA